ncbi:MAG TPA: hypothetical protein VJM33_17690, partial [Microthrixaceae bacterium]|nr:hypothetical protein [Microthrixaceae bacterium]
TGAAGPVDRMRSPQVLSPDTLLEASVGRAAVWGAAVGFVLFTVFVGLLGSWGGLNHAGALFLGMFTGFWGGLGFGAMVGGVVALNRAERDALAPEPARPEPA